MGGVLRGSVRDVTETLNTAHKTPSHSNIGGRKRPTPCQIAATTALCKLGHSYEYICSENEISACILRLLISRFKKSPCGDVVVQKKIYGRRL